MIKSFAELKEKLLGREPLRLAVVAARERAVLTAVLESAKVGWIKPILISIEDDEQIFDFSAG